MDVLAVSPTELTTAAALALAVGLHVSTWGAYKDSPYEGYHPWRQVRTAVLAIGAGVVVVGSGFGRPTTLLPALGVAYTVERLATEWWKTILRNDDQTAYAIPMRLGFRGRPVDRHWLRYGAGILVAAAIVLISLAVGAAQSALPGLPRWLVVATVGGLGGWLTAVGGAWKDAPVEGFSAWKFLRSPIVATVWAVPLSLTTSNWVAMCLGAGGMSVASIETYKTFFVGDRPPGKFLGKDVRSVSPALRRRLKVGHGCAWAVFAAIALVQGFVSGAASAALGSAVIFALAVACTFAVLNADDRLSPRTLPRGPGGEFVPLGGESSY